MKGNFKLKGENIYLEFIRKT